MVASDRISTYDVVHPNADPRQGQGAHRAVGVLVRPDGADRAPTTSSRDRRTCPTRCAAGRCWSSGSRCCRSSASCAATSPARAGRTTSATGAVCGIELPAGPARSPSSCRSRSSRPPPRPSWAITTRTSTSSARPRSSATATLLEELRDALARPLRASRPTTRASAGSSSPTRSSSSAAAPTARSDARRRGAHARLLALLARRRLRAGPGAAAASTSSTCATGPPAPAGTSRRPRPRMPDDVVAAHARALPRGLRARSPASPSPPGSSARAPAREGPRPHPPEGGHPRSAGPDRRARAAGALGFEGVAHVHVGPAGRARRARTPSRLPEMCERLLANPLIEDYEISWSSVKFGVVRFPGSCDEVDALRRCRARRRGGPALARRPRPRRASTRSSFPAGFSYGDYLRVGAIARFSPVMEAVARVRGRRRPGARASATASRCCARPACSRARCSPTPACASSAARWTWRSSTPTPPFTARASRGERLSIPVKHTTGRFCAPERRSTSSRPAARCCCATPPGRTPTARRATSPACRNAAGNVMGLMPHPEHAVDPLTGSADGRKLFESLRRACRRDAVARLRPAAAPPRARPHRRRVRAHRRAARARAQRASSWRCSR